MNPTSASPRPDWDLFCRVVDNFGDIGVCWRLARTLAAAHGLAVRLWVDDWDAFRRLCPAAPAEALVHGADGVEAHRWSHAWHDVEPAQAVVEAFGCELPEAYVAAMARQARAPAWINLEYLSAEAWVEECHLMPSPHPRLPLVKHFFFPGFTARTGGLLREPGLLAARERFQADPPARGRFLRELGVRDDDCAGRFLVSLFAYEQSGLPALLSRWSDAAAPILLLVPEGRVVGDVARCFGAASAVAGERFARGALTVQILPFVDQDRYDRLLWSCDLNFVRGEDSFVRAQWAARPFVWHIYAQQDEAHRAKLDAFLARLLAGLDADAAQAVAAFWRAWSAGGEVASRWDAFSAALPALAPQVRAWASSLAQRVDLASSLVQFSEREVK